MDNPVAMEKLPINQNGSQGYGFLLYRTTIDNKPEILKLSHPPHDRGKVNNETNLRINLLFNVKPINV